MDNGFILNVQREVHDKSFGYFYKKLKYPLNKVSHSSQACSSDKNMQQALIGPFSE